MQTFGTNLKHEDLFEHLWLFQGQELNDADSFSLSCTILCHMADQVDIGNDKDYAQMVTKARNKSPFEVKLFIFENQVCHSVLYVIMHLMGLMSWRRKLNIMSPLSLQRELFITPDLNNFFSALMLNLAFLP